MLAKALLVSTGDVNETLIRTTFVDVPIYAVTPRQIVDTMRAEYGVPTGDDVRKLREPFKVPLSAIADLNLHMSRFLLASTELDKSGQGEKPHRYFEMFLETMQGFSGINVAYNPLVSPHPSCLVPRLHRRSARSFASYWGLVCFLPISLHPTLLRL
jgi:hypothetical protein